MRIKVLRQESPVSKPYWQEFSYEKKENETVAGVLTDLNYKDDLVDVNGVPAPRIQWEHSCLQGMCGGCAMVINHRPALACETFIRDIRGDLLILEPLKKFPTIIDLVVDRTIIQDNLKKANAYIESFAGADEQEYDYMYAAAKCLKCGLCMEVCPNYKGGKSFYGAAFANDCYLIAKRSDTRGKEIMDAYRHSFEKGCSKSLSCVDVCPMHIPTMWSIASLAKEKHDSIMKTKDTIHG